MWCYFLKNNQAKSNKPEIINALIWMAKLQYQHRQNNAVVVLAVDMVQIKYHPLKLVDSMGSDSCNCHC